MEADAPSLVVATYNILASAYIQRARYPRSPAMVLTPAWRIPALLQQISTLEADILCLQEVEPETLAAINSRLGSRGHASCYARKGGDSPEGCSTFYRHGCARLIEEAVQVVVGSGGVLRSKPIDARAVRSVYRGDRQTGDPGGRARVGLADVPTADEAEPHFGGRRRILTFRYQTRSP